MDKDIGKHLIFLGQCSQYGLVGNDQVIYAGL